MTGYPQEIACFFVVHLEIGSRDPGDKAKGLGRVGTAAFVVLAE
jgi:hypothetical protein